MALPKGKRLLPLGGCLSLAVICGWMSGWPPPLWRSWSKQIADQVILWAGPTQPPNNLIVVAIDDASLQQARWFPSKPNADFWSDGLDRWPWPRAAYGVLSDRLLEAGARAVAINVLFAGGSARGPVDDQQFALSLKQHQPQVVLAAEMLEPEDRQGAGGLMLETPEPSLLEAVGGLANLGLTNMLDAEDGAIGPHPEAYVELLLKPHGFQQLKSLPTALLKVAGIATPSQDAQRFLRLYGPEGTIQRLSAWEILDPERWKDHPFKAQIAGSVILVGVTLEETSSSRPTAFGNLSGVELLATATANSLDGSGLERWPSDPLQRALIGGLSLLLVACVALQRQSLRWRLLSCGIGLGLLLSLGVSALLVRHRALPLLPPGAGLVVLSGLFGLNGYIQEERERRRLRRTFERYVSPMVVEEILEDRANVEDLLSGQTRPVTVLFSDLQGFTALTRKRSLEGRSEALVLQLNSYLGRMVEVIDAHGGTVDKFIGDCVMAVFGSPRSRGVEQEAEEAVRCAIAMVEAMGDLNKTWTAEKIAPLSCGIGIASGEAVVGEIGSPQRKEFTVIGDTVNLASRLEALTRHLHTPILMDVHTAEATKQNIPSTLIGEQVVKGIEEPIAVYRPSPPDRFRD